MKKILLMMFISLMLLCEATINEGMAQQPIKAGLTLDKEWYNLNEPIQASLTLTNSVPTPIITSKGFADSYFHLYLVFTDPDGKVITSDQLQNIRPFPPPPPRAINLQSGWGQAEPIEFLENNNEDKWCLSMSFNIREYYSSNSFSKAGKYSVKAMVPMRSYLGYEPIAGINYANVRDTNVKWKGFIESNIEHFTISGETPGRIDVFAELNKVIGRKAKKTPIVGMTVRIYDKTSNCVLQYGISWQNYSPDIWGNCSSIASGVTDQYGKVSFQFQAWDYIVIGHYTDIPPEEYPGLSAGGLDPGEIMQKHLLVIR